MKKNRVLVLGVGNILYTDEGIGVHAVRQLEQADLPAGVELMDGGTLGMALMEPIMNCERLIVLDAVLGGGAPGSLYRLEGDDLRKSLSFKDSLHQMDLVDTLICCELAGYKPEAVVLGMEPRDYRTMGLDLTPPCRDALPRLVQMAIKELGD